MSLDKFGRYLVGADDGVNLDQHGKQGPPGEGFKLTLDKQYDLQNKRLVNVGDPKNNVDAVNYQTLKQNCLMTSPANDCYNALGRRLCGVGQPLNEDDVISLKYANENYIGYKNKNMLWDDGVGYNAKGKLITNVKSPLNDTDAVPLSYMTYNSLMKTTDEMGNEFYNAGGKNIRNTKWPINGTDSTNKMYVDTMCPLIDSKEGGWQFLHQRLKGCADPKDRYDVVNYNTLLGVVHKLMLFVLSQSISPVVIPADIFTWPREQVIEFFFKNT